MVQVNQDEVLFERLSGRRVCPVCGEAYNVYFAPPLRDDLCDHDGAELVQRSDDVEATVHQRLMSYHDWTAPLVGFYRDSARLVEVDGDQPVGDVFEELCREIGLPTL